MVVPGPTCGENGMDHGQGGSGCRCGSLECKMHNERRGGGIESCTSVDGGGEDCGTEEKELRSSLTLRMEERCRSSLTA
jgi:hypothetical protein